ncbi:hypothetical protein G8759_20040 [Spirosoma aureum]|uniref:Uncharacterized protein n=1 Tax=Spirosoma aureum TaxID=2692134 RepID=A0A6G9ARA1_9BACT|nr:DUF6712 family protein [Spirosoma aureum]QIP14743.1 hypothetical protein G8759_20040 [Spirosoma aureum]
MALFTGEIKQFRAYVPGITINFSVPDVLPELGQTQQRILPTFFGETLASQLVALADEQDLTDPYKKQALHLARTAVARIGFAAYLPFCEVQIGDDGITITAVEGRKAAFEYQTNKLTSSLLEVGWRAVDELIRLVDSKPDLFPGWPDSPYYDEHQQALFKSPAEFSKYYPIQERWLTFWALRPFIRAVEENQGEAGKARIDALTDLQAATRTSLEKKLLRALAYQSVLEGLPFLSVELKGVNVQVNYASQFGNATYFEPPSKDQLAFVTSNLERMADLAWSAFDTAVIAASPAPIQEETMGQGILGGGPVTML